QLEPAMAIRRDHHGDLDALITQSRHTPGPLSLDHGAPFESHAERREELDGSIERLHNDANVVHAPDGHARPPRQVSVSDSAAHVAAPESPACSCVGTRLRGASTEAGTTWT